MKEIIFLILAICAAGCTSKPHPVSERGGNPTSEITMNFERGSFNFLDRFRISHEFLEGNLYGNMGSAPVGFFSCYQTERKDFLIYGDMLIDEEEFFKTNGMKNYFYGSLYQRSYKPAAPDIITKSYLLFVTDGFPGKVNVDGYRDVDDRTFNSLCQISVWGTSYVVGIRRFSIQTPNQSFEINKLYKKLYPRMTWDEPRTVKRGKNIWLTYKAKNPAIPRIGTGENWYLPIGDTDFYFALQFNYGYDADVANTAQFQKAKAAFERILDSFEITPLK